MDRHDPGGGFRWGVTRDTRLTLASDATHRRIRSYHPIQVVEKPAQPISPGICAPSHGSPTPTPTKMALASPGQVFLAQALLFGRTHLIVVTGARDTPPSAAPPHAAVQPWFPLLAPIDSPLSRLPYSSDPTWGQLNHSRTAISFLLPLIQNGDSVRTAGLVDAGATRWRVKWGHETRTGRAAEGPLIVCITLVELSRTQRLPRV